MKVFLLMSLFVYASWLAAIWPCWFRKCVGKVYQLQFLAFFGVMCTNIKFVWFGFAILSICVCLVSVWRSISAAYSSFSGDQLPQGRVCVGHPQSVHPAACQFVSSYFCSLFCMIVCLFSFICTSFFSLFYFSFLNISIPALAWSSNPLFFSFKLYLFWIDGLLKQWYGLEFCSEASRLYNLVCW